FYTCLEVCQIPGMEVYWESFRWMLTHGADPNTEAPWGDTPLHTACWWPDPRYADYLLQHGADPNVCTENSTPLHRAAMFGYLEVAKRLLDHGARANVRGHWGETPLHAASTSSSRIKEGHNKIMMALLLDHGAEVNAQVERNAEKQWTAGETPLHSAVHHSAKLNGQFLLERGAFPTIRDAKGFTPIELITQKQQHRIPELGTPVPEETKQQILEILERAART
ncbi:MAG: ankyrin repeat domain-containing protein, partial [Planctomycetales bacterium]